MSPALNISTKDRSHALAGALCLFGFFLYVALSGPLLSAIGFHYSGDEGHFYEKLHPGTFFIFLSFAVLIWDRGNPIRDVIGVARRYPAPMLLFALYVLLLIYIVLRSGFGGLAFLIDTHMTAPIAAMVLSCAPPAMCRRALWVFILIAALNSVIGIAEAAGKFRIFAFDPDWVVLHEQYFRASALRGHPLSNAVFTVLALFITLATRMPALIKIILALLFSASMIAFGSRSAMAVCLLALVIWGGAVIIKQLRQRPVTVHKILLLTGTVIIAPLGFAAFLFVLLHSGIGERLLAFSHWDESANSRILALGAFHYMTPEEIWLGASTERILDISYRLNLIVPLSALENPWLLMFMNFGAPLFIVWLAATVAFVWWLLRDKSLTLQIAALSYFAVASTYNSFGAKDPGYLIMVCAVICAAHMAMPYDKAGRRVSDNRRRLVER